MRLLEVVAGVLFLTPSLGRVILKRGSDCTATGGAECRLRVSRCFKSPDSFDDSGSTAPRRRSDPDEEDARDTHESFEACRFGGLTCPTGFFCKFPPCRGETPCYPYCAPIVEPDPITALLGGQYIQKMPSPTSEPIGGAHVGSPIPTEVTDAESPPAPTDAANTEPLLRASAENSATTVSQEPTGPIGTTDLRKPTQAVDVTTGQKPTETTDVTVVVQPTEVVVAADPSLEPAEASDVAAVPESTEVIEPESLSKPSKAADTAAQQEPAIIFQGRPHIIHTVSLSRPTAVIHVVPPPDPVLVVHEVSPLNPTEVAQEVPPAEHTIASLPNISYGPDAHLPDCPPFSRPREGASVAGGKFSRVEAIKSP